MLKLSSRARYALRSMITLARLSVASNPVSLARIAEKTHISRRYLEQVAISLKNADLIRGISGKGGGYILARSPGDIKAGEVIEAVIGPINIVDCVRVPDSCMMIDLCECRQVYVLINERILSALNSFTIADLAQMGADDEDCASVPIFDREGLYQAKSFPGGTPCTSK